MVHVSDKIILILLNKDDILKKTNNLFAWILVLNLTQQFTEINSIVSFNFKSTSYKICPQ